MDEQGLQTSRLAGLDAGAALLSPPTPIRAARALRRPARGVLGWARAAGALVIEDDYDAELRYDRLPIGAVQGLDPQRVVYGGSVSKVLSPALRLGWLIAPPQLTEDIVRAKFLDDVASEASAS